MRRGGKKKKQKEGEGQKGALRLRERENGGHRIHQAYLNNQTTEFKYLYCQMIKDDVMLHGLRHVQKSRYHLISLVY